MLDIETDGSITPREALASAGATLRSLVELVAEMSDEPQGLELGEVGDAAAGSPDLDLPDRGPRPVRASPQLPQAGPGQHRSASCSQKTEDDLLAITNFGQKSLDEVIAEARRARPVAPRPRTEDRPCLPPRRKGRRFGGDAAHQRLMMANLVASLIAAEGIVTTEAKAKALRPIAEKVITKAKKGGRSHNHRQVVVVPRRQGDDRTSCSTRSARATPTAPVATPASSSSAPATATTPRWPASNWSERPRA